MSSEKPSVSDLLVLTEFGNPENTANLSYELIIAKVVVLVYVTWQKREDWIRLILSKQEKYSIL